MNAGDSKIVQQKACYTPGRWASDHAPASIWATQMGRFFFSFSFSFYFFEGDHRGMGWWIQDDWEVKAIGVRYAKLPNNQQCMMLEKKT